MAISSQVIARDLILTWTVALVALDRCLLSIDSRVWSSVSSRLLGVQSTAKFDVGGRLT